MIANQLETALEGRYTIERELGRGGMATVYLARDLKHQRRVALKVLDPELGAVLGAERFLSEIRVTANLQHPNLLPLFDSGEAGGLLYYVMPFVEGETLRARLEREKQLPIDEAVRIATAVANALAFAHARGVIHRDLKPENILFQAGQPVVADFGIALAVSNAGGTRVTQTGLSLGTPQYMSPEQATGDRTVDARADVYALGAVTYEMLSGEPPFTGTTAQAIIARLMTTDPQPLTIVRRNVPAHVAGAVHHALEKLPADRFDSAKAFAEALSNPSFAALSSAAADAAPRRKQSLLIGGLAAACVAAAALAAWGWLRPAKPFDQVSARFAIEMPKGVAFSNVFAPLTITHDGRTVIFRAVVGDSVMLLRRDIDKLDAVPIPGTLGGERAAISPDDKWIAYERSSQVFRVPLAGGTPVSMGSALAGLSWITDDQIIAAEPNLVLLSTNGSPKTILAPDPKHDEILLRWPHVLPDRNTVFYVSWPRSGLRGARIGVLSLATGKSKILDVSGTTPLGVADGNLFYVNTTGVLSAVPFDVKSLEVTGSPRALIEGVNMNTTVGAARAALAESGTLVYIGGGSTMQLVLIEQDGTTRPLIAQTEVNAPTWSPDGKQIAVQVTSPQGKTDVGVVDATAGVFQRIPGDGNNRSPSWSPDGKRVLYVSNRDGNSAVWWQPIDGSGVAEKVVGAVEDGEATLSPDGASILLSMRPVDGKASLWWVDLKNSTKKSPLVNDPTAIHPTVTPDGKWLAYESRRTGRPEVFIRPFGASGDDRQISLDGGSMPEWSRDGRTLYYSSSGRQVVAASIELGANVQVISRRVAFQVPFPLSAGASSRSPTAVSPDGKQLAALSRADGETKIVVITNWLTELRRK